MRRLFQHLRSQIKYVVILPYLLLMILVMLVGSGIAITLVAGSWQERFNNQLGQVARNFAESFAETEITNIEYLGRIVFTAPNVNTGAPSVPEAMRLRDTEGLDLALRGLWLVGLGSENVNQDRLIVFDTNGMSLADWERSPISPSDPVRYIGTNLSQQPLVQSVLRGDSTPVPGSNVLGDKFSGLISFRQKDTGDEILHFFTVSPVYVTNKTGAVELVGGLMVTRRLDTLLQSLQNRSQSTISSVHDLSGVTLTTTATGINLDLIDMTPEQIERIALSNQLRATNISSAARGGQVADDPCLDIGNLSGRLVTPLERTDLPSCSLNTSVLLNDREYQFVYAPLLIRGVQSGYFSIALSRDFVLSAWASSRNAVIGVTAVLAALSVLVGFQVARRITRPLNTLVDTAEAVTRGDLQRRSDVYQENELGTLSSAFNQMTEHLLRLYTASREFNRSIDVDHALTVASEAAASFVPATEACAILESERGLMLRLRAAAPAAFESLNNRPVDPQSALVGAALAIDPAQEQLVRVADPATLESGGLTTAAAAVALIAPIYRQSQLAGILLFTHSDPDAFDEAQRKSLDVVANMTIAVLSNALLYSQVQHDATQRQAILTSIGDGVVVCDERGRIVLLNSAAEQILNLHTWEHTHPTIADLPLESVSHSQEVFGRSGDQFSLNGRYLTLTRSPVVGEDGRAAGEVIILHDITEAVNVDKAKTDFIATISHELRTPLTVIRGFTELLLRGTGGQKPSADQAELLDQVRVRAVDMTDMVNNAILIADIESGQLKTDLGPQDVEMILNLALTPLRSAFEAKHITVVTDLPEDLPAALADREQLKRAFSQLLDNARRYTDSGSVTIRARAEADRVNIDVSDTGRGINADVLPRLFKRFQRIEGNNSSQRGGGLGLAITKQLIERQGGQVTAVSTPGVGSTFSISLVQAHEQSLAVAQPNDSSTAS